MKQSNHLLCLLFFIVLPFMALAHIKTKVKPEAPCCSIISIGAVDGFQMTEGSVLVRNTTTGLTFQFKPDALDINSLHVGDGITADISLKKITAINNIGGVYPILQPDPIAPCCNIGSIKRDPISPCCSIVGIQSNGVTYTFSVPQNISATLKVGQPVYLAMKNSYAFFKTSLSGQTNYYSYPTNQSPGNDNSASKPWEMTPDNTLTGVTGQLVFQMPLSLGYIHLQVYNAGDTKVASSLFGNNKCKLLPGNYDVELDNKYFIRNIPVEKGSTTRLKVGILNYTPTGPVRIVDANKQEFSMAGPQEIALPEGTYYVDGKKNQAFEIKDGGITEY